MKECAFCGKLINIFQRKYKNKGYCATCYAYLFKKKICLQCGENKRIYRYLELPICQQCDLKGKPCIRCRKTIFSIGKITEDGPVCNSCSKYYRPKHLCLICGSTKHNVSKRLKCGEIYFTCDKCFNKKHFISCYKCKQRAFPFFFDLQRNAYCKPCTTKPNKNCKICNISMPAGHHSNTCDDCHAKNRIKQILLKQQKELLKNVYHVYQNYSNWLLNRRGAQLTSRQIIRDYEIFIFLDNYFTQWKMWPTYEEYVKKLSVKKARKHLLVTNFLNEYKIFSINNKIKANVGDLNTIDRLLDKIPLNSILRLYIDGYYKEMFNRYSQGKTSSRSFRLAITPAVGILLLGLQQDKKLPDDELIKQYLWLHYGQKAAITGFINFLRINMLISIEIPNKHYFQFSRPNETKARLKQKIITLLRSDVYESSQYIKTAIEYYHNIQFPNHLKRLKVLPIIYKNGWLEIILAGQKILIPKP